MNDEYFSALPDPGTAGGPVAPVWELSGWWRRVGASVIDYMLIWIPVSILVEVSGIGPDPAVDDYSIAANIDLAGMFAYLIASAIYFMATMSAWNGQTVGKRVTGIRVVREDGEAVDARYAFTRQTLVMGILFGWLAALLLFIPTFLNYLWPLWDEENQALHDKIVKSRVVRAYAVSDPGTFQVAQQQQPAAPFPVGTVPSPVAPAPPTPPTTSAPLPPPPPTPGGVPTPYTPPPGFENPVPDDD